MAAAHLPIPGFTQSTPPAVPPPTAIDVASEYVPLAHATAYLAPTLATPDTPVPPLIQAELLSDVQEPAVTAVQPAGAATLLYVPIGHAIRISPPLLTKHYHQLRHNILHRHLQNPWLL